MKKNLVLILAILARLNMAVAQDNSLRSSENRDLCIGPKTEFFGECGKLGVDSQVAQQVAGGEVIGALLLYLNLNAYKSSPEYMRYKIALSEYNTILMKEDFYSKYHLMYGSNVNPNNPVESTPNEQSKSEKLAIKKDKLLARSELLKAKEALKAKHFSMKSQASRMLQKITLAGFAVDSALRSKAIIYNEAHSVPLFDLIESSTDQADSVVNSAIKELESILDRHNIDASKLN